MTESDTDYQPGVFSSSGRSLEEDDEIRLTSVGVDIGSSTSHLVFSRLVLEQVGNRYVVRERHILHESDVLLTPYAGNNEIDADRLGAFIHEQYRLAEIEPEAIDTGALILTGVAVRRSNARAIGELFASEAGKFVAVSAGDGLETNLVAYGSGAVDRSRENSAPVMNVDIGGGTAKIALCRDGEIESLTAIDVGARIISFDENQVICALEPAGERFIEDAGLQLGIGDTITDAQQRQIAERMAERLFQAMGGSDLDAGTQALLRLEPLSKSAVAHPPAQVSFSGGVSEYLYGREKTAYGDLGPVLAQAVLDRIADWPVAVVRPREGLRATVVGASQYAVQVSGSTIFVSPQSALPVRNVPVVVPDIPFDEALDQQKIQASIQTALQRLDLQTGEQPVALCYQWDGMASFKRLDDFCRGIMAGLEPVLSQGHSIILVGDSDIGGLIGLHLKETLAVSQPLISIDGIALKEFDYIDIGNLLDASGSVPVVIKSLVFPPTRALGRAA